MALGVRGFQFSFVLPGLNGNDIPILLDALGEAKTIIIGWFKAERIADQILSASLFSKSAIFFSYSLSNLEKIYSVVSDLKLFSFVRNQYARSSINLIRKKVRCNSFYFQFSIHRRNAFKCKNDDFELISHQPLLLLVFCVK